MHREYTIKLLIFYFVFIRNVNTLELFIKNPYDNNHEKIEQLKSFHNKTYQMALFQKHYIKIKFSPDQLPNNENIIGFKFQIQSTDVRVVQIQKEIHSESNSISNTNNNILLEDLFILPKKNAMSHLFNVYPSPTLINLKNPSNIDIIWSIQSLLLEETNLKVSLDIFYQDNTISTYIWSLNILVTQPKRLIDQLFQIILPFLVVFISIQMGILLNTTVLIDLVKNPKPVLIGFLSQYGLMPFLSMAIAKIFHYSPLYSLALFVIGCCPGSGASNQWTLLFDGDVNLSAIMSFVSTASSFIMMPLYFYTIGRIYTDELSIRVPFIHLCRSLALVVIPYSIGITISYFSPKIRSIVEKLVKPMMLFLLLFFLVFGTIVNWYLIQTIDLHTALTAPLLPYLGFLLGAIFAWICHLDWIHIKTIGIEAGIQNVGIAFMIIYYSFPQPYATKAIVVPLIVAFLTTKPFWLIYVIRNQINKYKKKNALKTTDQHINTVNEKPSLNNEENNKKEDLIEMIQNL